MFASFYPLAVHYHCFGRSRSMKSRFLFFFLCAVLIITDASPKRHRRRKKENDERSWGFVDDKNDNRQRLPNDEDVSTTAEYTRTTEREKTDDEIRASIEACKPYSAVVPDYSEPGRRVSQVKCLEFIWYIKSRYDEQFQERQCFWEFMARKGFVGGDQIGGRIAKDGEFPHMGAVGWKAVNGSWIFKCGATLISDKFALTAAHCTRDSGRDEAVSDPVPKIVRLGDNSILDPVVPRRYWHPVDREIIRIIKHRAYKSPKVYNDIALFEFEKPVEFTYNIHPACLWGSRNMTSLGTQATSSGWGVVDIATRATSPELQVTVLDLINHEQCNSLLSSNCNRKFCGVKNSQICAGKLEGGVDSCQGDSGGPLQTKIKLPIHYEESMHYVIGVTSFGFGCAKANSPGIYTRVSSYIDWIEQNVWGSHGVQPA